MDKKHYSIAVNILMLIVALVATSLFTVMAIVHRVAMKQSGRGKADTTIFNPKIY